MAPCGANKRDGTPCTLSAIDDSGCCWAHSPHRAEERSRGARKAGKAGGRGRAKEPRAAEARTIRADLLRMAAAVEAGELDKGRAAVAGQLLNYGLAGLRTELKAEEQDDLLVRLEALEARLDGGAEAKPWR